MLGVDGSLLCLPGVEALSCSQERAENQSENSEDQKRNARDGADSMRLLLLAVQMLAERALLRLLPGQWSGFVGSQTPRHSEGHPARPWQRSDFEKRPAGMGGPKTGATEGCASRLFLGWSRTRTQANRGR